MRDCSDGRTCRRRRQSGAFQLSAAPWDDDRLEMLEADNTDLARALSRLNLTYDAYDYTTQAAAF